MAGACRTLLRRDPRQRGDAEGPGVRVVCIYAEVAKDRTGTVKVASGSTSAEPGSRRRAPPDAPQHTVLDEPPRPPPEVEPISAEDRESDGADEPAGHSPTGPLPARHGQASVRGSSSPNIRLLKATSRLFALLARIDGCAHPAHPARKEPRTLPI